jgi:hypothetical protein
VAKVPDPHRHEDEGERLDRQLMELLGEIRVVLPGVQVLFAFLLVVPFQQKFDTLTDGQQNLYYATLLLAALATALLIAPSAFHREVFQLHEKPRVISYGTRFTLAGLASLALAMTGAVALISDLIFGDAQALVAATVLLVLYGWFWFGAGLLVHRRSG